MALYQIREPSRADNLVPQAILNLGVETIADRARFETERGFDDLDHYTGFDAVFDQRFVVALRHYDGHPQGTTTIYLPIELSADDATISFIVSRILEELKISSDYLVWERRHGVKEDSGEF